VHAHHPSANITQGLVTAVALCFSPQVIRGQVGAQTQTFVIHGTPKTCSDITQLDSALSAGYQQFFAGWTEKDYVDAVAWSQACSEYGWHVQGRPRIPLLQARHDRVLGSTQTQIVSSTATGSALPSPPVQSAVAAAAQAVPATATDSALLNPSAQAVIAAPVEAVASSATGSALPNPPVQAPIAASAEAVASSPTGSAQPNPPVQAAIAAPTEAVASAATGSAQPNPPVQAAIAAPAAAVASAATGSAQPNPPVQAAIAAPAAAVASAVTGSAQPNPPVQAAIAAPAAAVASAATGSAQPNPPVQAAIAAPTEAVASAATGSALPNPPVQAAIAAPPQAVASTATSSTLPTPPVPVDIPVRAQTLSSTAKGTALPIPRVRRHTTSVGEEDSVLADDFFKEHFHQESLWVANKANLDIGDDREPSSWSNSGMPAQMKNRLTADRIVLYCARKTNDEPGKRPLLWDLRWCEAEEASAYNRLVSGNEFPTAGRGVVLGCAGVDSYVNLERCMETLTEAGGH
jgi:hypothetical protein